MMVRCVTTEASDLGLVLGKVCEVLEIKFVEFF